MNPKHACTTSSVRNPVQRAISPSDRSSFLHGLAGIALLVAPAAGQESGRKPLLPVERILPLLPASVAGGDGDVRVTSAPQDLTTLFEERGVEISPGTGAPTLRLALVAWGRAKTRVAAFPGGKTTHGNRVEYRRGAVTEWFVDGRRGLQQGFTVDAPPAGTLGDGLALELDLGGWRAEILPGGRDAELVDASGEWRLTYTGLLAWDANRVALDAALVASEGGLTIQVDDRGAAYPLTIDPWIATELTRLDHPVPTSFDDFGQSVAISSDTIVDTIVVGTPGDDHTGAANSGRIDILVGGGKSWTSQAAYVGIAAEDRVGQSVAVENDTVVYGAPLHDPLGIPDAGAAWILHRSGTTWTFEATLVLSFVGGAANFGASVAIDGNTAIVGAPLDDHSGKTDVGTAEVFVRSGTSWVSQGLLKPSPAVDFAQAGVSVAVFSNTAVLGAANDSCYVFTRSGSTWTQQQRITGPAGTQFGSRVAIGGNGGNWILAGAPGEDHSALTDPGAIYVFVRSGSTWSQEARLTASDPQTDARFGASVALVTISADYFGLVGAPGKDSGRGAAYLLRRSLTWSEQDCVAAATGLAGDVFGTSVSASGSSFVVGAPDDDHSSRTNAGSAYVFRWSEASYPQHFEHLDGFQLDGQDGWTASEDLVAIDLPTSRGVWNEFGGVGIASRVADEASPLPTLDGSERDAYMQFDALGYAAGSIRFGVATDVNQDGVVGLSDADEHGPMIERLTFVDHQTFRLISADDSVLESSAPVSFDDVRLRLVMDLRANGGSGSGSLYRMNLSASSPAFTAVPGLQHIDLKLDAAANDGRDPTRWNALYFDVEGELLVVDSLTLAESASGYDFDCLPAKDTGVYEPLFEGGWVATPRNTSIRTGVTESLSHDGTSCLAFDQVGPGVGCDQSLVDSPGYWSLPTFDGSERNVTVQFDATVSFWGNFFGLASDLDGSRHVTLTDAAERGPELVLFATSGGGVRLRAADGTTTTVPLANAAGATGGQWLRMKLEMDLRVNGGSGLGNVFAMNLSNSETEFTPVAGLQGIDLRLDRANTSARDPRRWNGLFSHFEGAGNRLDNIKIGGNPYRHKVRER